MSLPEALERAATALAEDADLIRPANGDPHQLLSTLDAAAAVRVLSWLLVNEPEDGEELVTGWCEDDRGVVPLQALDPKALPKAGRKVLKKALHRMRTSGIEVAETRAADPVVSRLSSVSDEIGGTFLTAVDPRGSYLVFMVEANPTGGARLFQVLLDEVRGVVEFDVYATNRSKVRGFLRKLCQSKSTGAVEVDSDIVRALIRRISAIHPADRPLPRGFSEWRLKLEQGASESTPAERVLSEAGAQCDPAPLSAEDQSAALDRVAAQVRDSSLGPWPPPTTQLTQISEKLDKEIDSVLEAEGDARATALEAAIALATAEMFSGDHGSQTATRLEMSAYVAWKGESANEARDFLVAAGVFRAGESNQPNSVARAMLEICSASVLKRAEGDSSQEQGESATETES